MRHFRTIALLALASGCTRSNEADSFRVIAAIEVRLRTTADHDDLISIARRIAAANGMHVDDDSQRWADFQRSLPPNQPMDTRATIYVGVWRGSSDDDFEVSVSDMTHLGRAWVTFLQGGRIDLPAEEREKALAEIRARWPDARSVPVLPSGGEPLAEDLRLTPRGYKIAASAASRYQLPANSPLLVRD